MEEITKHLFELQDLTYRTFNAKLIPGTDPEKIIGIRTPALRKYAKELIKTGQWREFIRELPHQYHEENALHGYILGTIKEDYEEVMELLEEFLPYVENWGVCDTICPKIFKKHPREVYEKIKGWVKSEHEYTVRFAVVSLLQFFLDEEFRPEMLELVAGIHREEYYINMAVAWYFSFALIKQYEIMLPLVESKSLDPWIQNKTIQKAVESYRISDERKQYLRTLKN
ncbi:MAG: DNA alkylation repair protein [Lachnospiraceae bacterium]|nr:DNA alkylation repair protein [Lachnospiraceae bacterium]